jgi:hypothetical protein
LSPENCYAYFSAFLNLFLAYRFCYSKAKKKKRKKTGGRSADEKYKNLLLVANP